MSAFPDSAARCKADLRNIEIGSFSQSFKEEVNYQANSDQRVCVPSLLVKNVHPGVDVEEDFDQVDVSI